MGVAGGGLFSLCAGFSTLAPMRDLRPSFSQRFPNPLWAVLGAVAVVLFGLLVFAVSLRAELDQAAERGRADLALASDRLTSGLQRYRELAVFLADHPVVTARVFSEARGPEGEALLQAMADKTGASALALVSRGGVILATAGQAQMPKGAQAAFERAMDGALGVAHFVDPEGQRQYVFAAPVFAPNGPAQGAVLVRVNVADLEWSWPANPEAVYFTDSYGVVFVSNRSELILRGGREGTLPVAATRRIAGHELWRMAAGPYIPARALHLSQPLPVVGLEAELLMDLAPVIALAALQGGMAAALAAVFVMALWFAGARRRTLAQANARLEARVAARTQDLEAANRDLRQAQADLVQAGKLAALGEMSAGISHELNQPLMAIRSFAENGEAFLRRGQPERAGENLARISEATRRMGRIIKNLRAFARQEVETIADVELCAVVEAALEMMQGKISDGDVSVDWDAPDEVWVRGGEVRLQQVVMNLMSNAVDAMRGQESRRMQVRIDAGDPVRLRVADSGSGIAEPEKVFDPFYTTKEVGASEGVGLGLSISYGLIQSFGGRIRGDNRAAGGAEFTVELMPARRGELREAEV